MRKLTMISILVLISVIVLLPLAAIGLRDVLLRQTDCLACRRIFSLVFRPADYHAPVAISRTENGISRLYLFPRYVGPYSLKVYDVSDNSEVAVVRFYCSENIGFKAASKPNKYNKVFTWFGDGFILGGLRILPKQVAFKEGITCDIELAGTKSALLVITLASEL